MAARINLKHDPHILKRIEGVQLVKRLQDHVFAAPDSPTFLTDSQVRAGLGLLKKIVPDLANMQHTGPDAGPIQVETIRRVIHDPKA